ncbi:MAG: hypothetical protein ACUVRV_12720 [Cyanobacteriota bacterium]
MAQLGHQQPADLILCNVEMLRMSGFEFLNQQRKVCHLLGSRWSCLPPVAAKAPYLAMQLGTTA